MKGRNPTRSEKYYHTALVENIGCAVCYFHHGEYNDYVSIHHIDGRTKPDAHKNVIPLCGPHHQERSGDFKKGIFAVHPHRARFKKEYGSELELKRKCDELLNEMGIMYA